MARPRPLLDIAPGEVDVGLAAEPRHRKDALGNVYQADVSPFQAARTLAGVGAKLRIGMRWFSEV